MNTSIFNELETEKGYRCSENIIKLLLIDQMAIIYP